MKKYFIFGLIVGVILSIFISLIVVFFENKISFKEKIKFNHVSVDIYLDVGENTVKVILNRKNDKQVIKINSANPLNHCLTKDSRRSKLYLITYSYKKNEKEKGLTSSIKRINIPPPKTALNKYSVETILQGDWLSSKLNSSQALISYIYSISDDNESLLIEITDNSHQEEGKTFETNKYPYFYNINKKTLEKVRFHNSHYSDGKLSTLERASEPHRIVD